MKNKFLAIILTLLLFNGCQSDKINMLPEHLNQSVSDIIAAGKYQVNGKVNLADYSAGNNDFNTKLYDTAKLTNNAVVTLLYPSDYTTENLRNRAIATGVTDSSGNFSINPLQNFIPVNNQVYVLEAGKRIGGPGNSFINLRTLVRWNGSDWQSITDSGVIINKSTTAIAMFSNFKSSELSSSDAIGRIITDTDGNNTITYDQKMTYENYALLITAIDEILYYNYDPVESIYSATDYSFYSDYIVAQDRVRLSSVKANMHTMQTIAETYAVDWGGVYPEKATELKDEAKMYNYWKNFKNPFTSETDNILDYDSYFQIKDTLIFNGKKLEGLFDLRGYILYKSVGDDPNGITTYVIYGLDAFGEFLKDKDRVFYLTNN